MEITGEDDHTNIAGARSTGRDLQQKQAGEQEWSAQAPTPADLTETQEWSVQPSPPMPMQLMNTPCHSGERPESNVPDRLWDWWNEDQQRQWLQVQPWDNADPWHRYGIVASCTERQQNHSWDQWNHCNANDWNHLGLHVAMMMGGRRGHSGMVTRRSTQTRAHLRNGTEIILTRPGATIVGHWSSG